MSADETRRPSSAPAESAAGLSPVKQALAEIRTLRARLAEAERQQHQHEPIAIVGMGCRFPGAASPDEFWTLLHEGRDAIREVPSDRWDLAAYFDANPDAPGRMSTRWGGFLDDVDRFDARFFGVTPREAVRIDPQQRLLLEVAWESLEHAGIAPDGLLGAPVGVFVGLASTDYLQMQLRALPVEQIDAYLASGNSPAVASGRLSYLLGFQGPSVTVDTACSASLVAVHQACQALRAQECRLALAGGVCLTLLPEMTVNFSKARMMAADGRCKTFDAAADGYVRSEGCGVVVLKRLRDAVADDDRIWAVIRGSAVNQDGRSSGLTVPNGPAQEAVIRAALARAGVPAAEVSYVEAHGTGTALGDPIEVGALGNVFRDSRPTDCPLIVGSVKTNIGHLEAAAGVAGLIKIALALEHGEIPRHLHLLTPNPLIDWPHLPIVVPTEARAWPRGERPRIAGLSSFGFSGTNAHVIVEEGPRPPAPAGTGADAAARPAERISVRADERAPAPVQAGAHAAASPTGTTDIGFAARGCHVLPLSAKTHESLVILAERMAAHLDAASAASTPPAAVSSDSPPAGSSALTLADVSHTAGVGRAHASHRAAVVAENFDQARAALHSWSAAAPSSAAQSGATRGAATTKMAAVATGSLSASATTGVVLTGAHTGITAPEVAFLFTGQGAQYAGMGRTLYETEPVFRHAMDRCAAILAPRLDRPLLPLIFEQAEMSANGGGQSAAIDETIYTQPALFALEYALVELWRSWGVHPTIVMGHSLGEDVAACVAGVFTLEEGLALIAERGRLMQALPRDGEMMALFADEARVAAAIVPYRDAVSIAAVNGPEAVTISGERRALRAVVTALEREGVKARPVTASHAFHSPLMDPMLAPFEAVARGVTYRSPTLPLVSNITGRLATDDEICTASYWRRHVREPVRFGASMQTLWDRGCRLFVEIGPSPVLLGMGQRAVPDGGAFLPSLRKGRHDSREILTSLACLYTAGVNIDWRGVSGSGDPDGGRRRRVVLPTYPFDRQRYWFSAGPTLASPAAASSGAAPRPAAGSSPWDRTIAAAARQAGEGPLDLHLASYPAKWAAADALSVAFIVRTFQTLGLFSRAGERHDLDGLIAQCGIKSIYARLVERWLEALVERGSLRREGATFVADRPLAGADPHGAGASDALTAQVDAARALLGADAAIVDYIARSGSRLPDLLTGRESPLDMLFPDGSTMIADALYQTSPPARYVNAIARAAVAGAAVGATSAHPVRVLEIGAGTGGTTTGLLDALPSDATRYLFTDVGPLFLAKARERFAAHPFMTYATLDIERHPREQGFQAHAADVIVAANVLHATKSLRETLAHVAWLLAPGGVLVLSEGTTHPLWFDVTIGLIGGWQRFADDVRGDVPLLSPAAWERVLLAEGFAAVRAYPEVGSPAEILRQHIIVARGTADAVASSDGVSHPGTDTVAAAHVGLAGMAATSSGMAAATAAAQNDGAAPTDANAIARRARLEGLTPAEQLEQIAAFVRETIMRVLALDPAQPPDREGRLMDLGVDSLMAVEIRHLLTQGFGLSRKLPATLIFDHPTIDAIAGYVQRTGFAERSADEGESVATGIGHASNGGTDDEVGVTPALSLAAVDAMSDEDVEALLNQRLERM